MLSFVSSKGFSSLRRHLLWIDCTAGLLVGILVLLLDDLLSRWYGLPQGLIFFLGLMNIAYGTYSLSLALRKKRPMSLIRVLAIGNMVWTMVCVGLVLSFLNVASPVGLALLLGEGIFVGGLGLIEWRSRHLLAST